jgi:hypothetical protein
MLVDVFERQKNRRPKYVLETFFGQLQHLFCIRFAACPDLGMEAGATVLLAAIKTCVILEGVYPTGLDMHAYSRLGALHFVDLKNVQCLVGRIHDRGQWTIIDRSGSLARAMYIEDE